MRRLIYPFEVICNAFGDPVIRHDRCLDGTILGPLSSSLGPDGPLPRLVASTQRSLCLRMFLSGVTSRPAAPLLTLIERMVSLASKVSACTPVIALPDSYNARTTASNHQRLPPADQPSDTQHKTRCTPSTQPRSWSASC